MDDTAGFRPYTTPAKERARRARFDEELEELATRPAPPAQNRSSNDA